MEDELLMCFSLHLLDRRLASSIYMRYVCFEVIPINVHSAMLVAAGHIP